MRTDKFVALIILLLLTTVSSATLSYTYVNQSMDSNNLSDQRFSVSRETKEKRSSVQISASKVFNTTLEIGGGPTTEIANNVTRDQAQANGWPGTGTVDDPIIISGYLFENFGGTTAILIFRTSLYIVLENNIIDVANGVTTNFGIYSSFASNVRIRNNVIRLNYTNTQAGIYMEKINASNIVIEDNEIVVSSSAISFWELNGFEIRNNYIESSGGISVSNAYVAQDNSTNYISGNEMYTKGNSISIYNDWNNFDNRTTIVENNQLESKNGKGIYFQFNSNNEIKNNTISVYRTHNSIHLSKSYNNIVTDNNLFGGGMSFPFPSDETKLQDIVENNFLNGIAILYLVYGSGFVGGPFSQAFVYYSNDVTMTMESRTWTDAVQIAYSFDVMIEDSIFMEVDQAIDIRDSGNIMIRNNTFDHVYSAIDCSNCSEVNIVSNMVDFSDYGFNLHKGTDVSIENNSFFSLDSNAIDAYDIDNLQIMNNFIDSIADDDGIYISDIINSQVSNNIIMNVRNGNMFGAYNISHTEISNNQFRDSEYNGIAISSSSNTTIDKNFFVGMGSNGINFYDVKDSEISNNFIDKIQYSGLSLSDSEDLSIHDNFLGEIEGNAIYSYSNGLLGNISIAHNIFYKIRHYILQLYGDGGYNFTENDVYTNGIIRDYMLIDTPILIFVNHNYWSHFSQPDSDNDGIVDQIYNETSIQDFYPSTHPLNQFPSEVTINSNDIVYEVGMTGNYIHWQVNGLEKGVYSIYDPWGLLIEDQLFYNGSISLNVDGLDIGRYVFTLVILGLFNDFVVNSVVVEVIDHPTSTTTTTPTETITVTQTHTVQHSITITTNATLTNSTSSSSTSQAGLPFLYYMTISLSIVFIIRVINHRKKNKKVNWKT